MFIYQLSNILENIHHTLESETARCSIEIVRSFYMNQNSTLLYSLCCTRRWWFFSTTRWYRCNWYHFPTGWFYQDNIWSLINESVVLIKKIVLLHKHKQRIVGKIPDHHLNVWLFSNPGDKGQTLVESMGQICPIALHLFLDLVPWIWK